MGVYRTLVDSGQFVERQELAYSSASQRSAAVENVALAAQTAMAQQQLALQGKLATLAAAKANAPVAEAVNTLYANTSLVNSKATNINAQAAQAKAEKR